MREFFIIWMERVMNVLIALGGLAVAIGTIVTLFSAKGGIVAALGVLVLGSIYLVVLGGAIYLGLGIYNNTRRTAEAVEQLARR